MLTQALKARKARLADEKGFTLIELLAVIVILAIIAVIAIPLIGNVIDNSKEDGDLATARQIYDAARLYVIGEENGDFTTVNTVKLGVLQSNNFIEKNIALPSSKVKLNEETTIVSFDEHGNLTGVKLDPPGKGKTDGYSASEILGVKTTP
ncbi:prepilin-type N-terminal cleavage/methylation domain-containing protein [Paenibacillus polygoni]|uniref:Prepilin-type N-terminal cleavage/methylation domain-containing protein n=1 Tax=Paenibacillus polygoni TaxID=3050112 RepID=A0ABY8X2H8_9BACL|nr:prepilin-type N-terminal cleavage/methylation domain-containing protein [Paenibacillus polygoni]WIV18204.1 prepilin-type N-terminal cleavage/methylation domain-containing protein [Paenibacillus polygoni]